MAIAVHFLLFLLSAVIIWFFAGLVIESVNNTAHRFHQSGFTVAFFVLGFLTSISEISVMVNSTLSGAPQVSAGNLAGASFVILLFIVPVLAIVGNGIQLKNTLRSTNLALALCTAALPTLLLLDGDITKTEGLVCFLVYGTLLYFIRRQQPKSVPKIIEAVEHNLISKRKATAIDVIKIIIGAAFIFLAGHIMVDEVAYFSIWLGIPSSIIGLLILSLGTNIPELVIAVRSILKKRTDIAFGDYLGSTVANTLVFGFLPWFNGKFSVEATEFFFTAVLMIVGFASFYLAAKSKNQISKSEGLGLALIYAGFIIIQLVNFVRFATD